MNGFSSKHKTLIIIFFLTVVSFLLTAWTLTLIHSLLIALIIILFVYFTRYIWFPNDYGKTIVRKISLGIAISFVASLSFWQTIEPIFLKFVRIFAPEINNDNWLYNHTLILYTIFVLLVIFIVNYFMQDKSAMKAHPKKIFDEISEPKFEQRFANVCASLKDDLRNIDRSTNWSSTNYVSLNAEVEIRSDKGNKRKVTDLLKAIKKSNDRLFLVLGDPGAGKSVALRKLAMDLFNEAEKTGKMPIYINLKEWKSEHEWTINNPPTQLEFYEFVKSNLKKRDIVANNFFEKYFDKLYESGRLYFILDSFDEMPQVLDHDDNSEIIDILSTLFFKFLKGARYNSSQGILSSRFFRKPTESFQARTVLEIRPLDEDRILKILQNSGLIKESIIKVLFKNRLDLITLARNPFTLTLIEDYIIENNSLPLNQSELYSSFIQTTINNCNDIVFENDTSVHEIMSYSGIIAHEIFNSNSLEIKMDTLRGKNDNIGKIINVLEFAKIGRRGLKDDKSFSFSHRRFCEYFAIQFVIDNEVKTNLEDIPTDSKWRDALVLYCEIVDVSEARKIANFCWQIISSAKNLQNSRALHCLRFLNDAFIGRKECMLDFANELETYLEKEINEKSNLLTLKLAIESTGLISNKGIVTIIEKAFSFKNYWLNETCIRSCRHLPSLNESLKLEISNYLNKINAVSIIVNQSSYNFSLKLSDGFLEVFKFYKIKLFSSILLCSSFLIFAIFFPHLFLVGLIGSLVMTVFDDFKFENLLDKRTYFKSAFKTFRLMHFMLLLFVVWNFNNFEDFNYSYFESVFDILNINVVLFYSFISFEVLTAINYSSIYLYSKKVSIKKDFKSDISTLIFIVLFFALLYFFGEFLRSFLIGSILLKIVGYIVILFPAILIFERIRPLIKGRKIYKRINKSQLNTRPYLFESYNKLNDHSFYQLQLIKYVQKNIQKISGEWPDDSIFEVNNKEQSILLAKLEEKWLGLN